MLARLSVLIVLVALPLFSACELPAGSPKAQTANAVFNDLVQAAGNGEKPQLAVVTPDCVSASGPERGAWYEEKYHRVNLDVTLFDMCADAQRQLGDRNCLAFLLGHELAHVFRDHYRTSTLVSGLARAGPPAAADAEGAALERDADLFGGIYGYRAGYDSLRNAPKILDAVYQTYKLSAKLKGYPDLDQRKKTAELSLLQLRKLIPIFETGNLMLLLGQYQLAANCFEDLERKFPAREMFNNHGVALSLDLASLRENKDGLQYPWVLDSGSRLQLAAESSRGETRTVTAAELFAKAKQAFEEAKRLDANYVPAYLNLALLYDLNRPGDKHAALELEDGQEHISAYPALAPVLQSAQKFLATHAKSPSTAEPGELEIPEEDSIGDMTASSLLNEPPGEGAMRVGGEPPLTVGPVKHYDTYEVLPVQGAGRRWVFLATGEKYANKTAQGARIGSTAAELDKAYCSPDQKCGAAVQTAAGRYVHFKKARTIFLLDSGSDKEAKVVKWFLYAQK